MTKTLTALALLSCLAACGGGDDSACISTKVVGIHWEVDAQGHKQAWTVDNCGTQTLVPQGLYPAPVQN